MSTKTKTKIKKLPANLPPLPPVPAGFKRWELCGWGGLICAENSGTVWNSHYADVGTDSGWFSEISHKGEARGNPDVFYIRAIKHPAPKTAASAKVAAALAAVAESRPAMNKLSRTQRQELEAEGRAIIAKPAAKGRKAVKAVRLPNSSYVDFINEILDHQIANRGTRYSFYRCFTYGHGKMPKWVSKAERLIAKRRK